MVNGSQLAFAAWAVALHLWFVPVYLVVVALTPIAVATHQRWGLAVPAALALAVVGVDIAVRCADLTIVGWPNYLLCWAAVYQLGIAWHGGTLRGGRALLTAVCSAGVLPALLALRLYPVSMVGVAGQRVQNTSPPPS